MNIFDIVIVLIAVVVIILSAKKGFVSSCLDALSVAISSLASYKLCTVVSDALYDFFIKDLIKTEFKQALDDISSSATLDEKATAMIQSLPETARKLATGMGININNVTGSAINSQMDDEALIEQMASSMAYDVMIKFVEVIVFIALFVIFALVIRFVSNFFSHNLSKLPVVGTVDTILGGALGAVKALIILLAGSALLYIIAKTAEPGSTLQQIEASKIYMFMVENNPIIHIFTGGNV